MHIEPGVVDAAKMTLSYATAAGAGATALYHVQGAIRHQGVVSTVLRSLIATAGVLFFFEVLPHFSAGVSEVHFIFGSMLFLILGAGPAAIGLGSALLLQGLFFAPFDLPQFGMNLTTLLVPLFLLDAAARRLVAPGTAYVDLGYAQVLKMSAIYQGGVIAWVAFWVIYGQGMAAFSGIATFAVAYAGVIVIEPLVDLAVLAGAKSLRGMKGSNLVTGRLYNAA